MDVIRNLIPRKKTLAILTAVSLVSACEFSRVYVPDFVEDKFTYRMNRILGILLANISKIGGMLNFGNGNEVIVFRNLLNKVIKNGPVDISKLRIINTKSNNVPIRIYLPVNKPKNCPIMIYFHGGAYCFMNIDNYEELLIDFINQQEMVIVSVELAPEFPFPNPINDCYQAASYLLNNLLDFDLGFVDKNKIFLAGDSAGAHISTIISNQLLEKNDIHVNSQCLIYPPTQYFNFLLPSAVKYANLELPYSRAKFLLWHLGIEKIDAKLEDAVLKNLHITVLEDENLNNKYKSFLNINLIPEEFKKNNSYYANYENLDNLIYPINLSEKDREIVENFKDKLKLVFDISLSPGLADDDILKKQPKTLMIVCENDSRKDESLIYGERLKRNGVAIETVYYENGFHGLITNPSNKISIDMRQKIIAFVKKNIN